MNTDLNSQKSSYDLWLDEIEVSLNAGGRKLSLVDKLTYFRIKKPSWCNEYDELHRFFKHFVNTFRYGKITWGVLVRANKIIFDPGKKDCPADIIYSPNLRGMPEELLDIASEVYDLQESEVYLPPEVERLRKMLLTYTDRFSQEYVPHELSGKRECLMSSVMLIRKHLPNFLLDRSIFPLLVHEDDPYGCVIVPSKYWPQDLIKHRV